MYGTRTYGSKTDDDLHLGKCYDAPKRESGTRILDLITDMREDVASVRKSLSRKGGFTEKKDVQETSSKMVWVVLCAHQKVSTVNE